MQSIECCDCDELRFIIEYFQLPNETNNEKHQIFIQRPSHLPENEFLSSIPMGFNVIKF